MIAPFKKVLSLVYAAAAAAADSLGVVGRAPYAGTVTAVEFIPNTTITGANTESRTFNLINKGQGGVGTTVIATLAMVSGVNATGMDVKNATLSVVAGATTVVAGDVLAWQSLHVGSTGLADPGGRVEVTIGNDRGD